MRVLGHFYDEFYAIIMRFYIYSITYCIIDIFWVFRLLRIPLSKALVMPCRDEMSKRINFAFAVTERKENRTLREKSRFAGAKRFALQNSVYEKLDGKGRR